MALVSLLKPKLGLLQILHIISEQTLVGKGYTLHILYLINDTCMHMLSISWLEVVRLQAQIQRFYLRTSPDRFSRFLPEPIIDVNLTSAIVHRIVLGA